MRSRRTLAIVVILVMGTLQLWDSRVFSAGPAAIVIAVGALALPIWTLMYSERMEVRMGAVVVCALMLLSAKLVAPHPLPAIGVAAVVAAAASWLAAARPTA
jgi:hypothetical protein